jgi:peptide/nickel transport system permease protein
VTEVATAGAPARDAPVAGGGVAARARHRRRLRRAAQRLARILFILWGVATTTWIASKARPGGEAVAIAGGAGSSAPPELIEAIKRQYGLDRPLIAQYLDYFRHLLTGDLGYSTSQFRPVSSVIAQNIGPTAQLAGSAIFLAWLMVIVWTLLTVKRRRPVSAIGSGVQVALISLPAYWLGMLLIEVFVFRLNWVPAFGATGGRALILPALSMALPLAGFIGQLTRLGFETTLEQPFIISARARGMTDWKVRTRHVLRHAILPGLSVTGVALGASFGGAVLAESLFVRQGIGTLLLMAVARQDTSLTVGITLTVALVYVLANLVADGLYVIADPRMKAES